MLEITPISAILLVTTAINTAVSLIGWKRRDTQTGYYFAVGMMSITLWTFAAALGYMAVPLSLKIFFAKVDSIGYNFAIILFLFSMLYFAGFDQWANDKWVRRFILLFPIINILLTITNDLHNWVWVGFTPVGNNIYIFEHGPAFVWLAATNYAASISIIIILLWILQKGPAIQRRQARLLLFATLFPLAANIVYLYGVEGARGVDWSSVTFSVTGFFFLRALQSAQFTDIIPIARDRLISSLSDGIIVVDIKARIIDINPAAEAMLGLKLDSVSGQNLEMIMPRTYSKLMEAPGYESRMEFEAGSESQACFDVLISPLYEKGQTQRIGNLIVFRDITERKKNEIRLQQLNRAVEQSPISVFITDKNGNITFVNPFFIMSTGYSISEVIGKNLNIIKSDQTPDEVYGNIWKVLHSKQVWNGELINKKKSGELYWAHLVIAPVLDTDGNIQSFIAVQEDITERKLTEQALENRFLEIQKLNNELQNTQSQLVEQQRAFATLDERRRIGRNLHDSVNQSIHSLMLFSETLIALLQDGDVKQAIHAAERIHESGEQALKEVRLLVHEGQAVFMGGYTDLIQAIEYRLNMVERRVGIQADFSYDLSALERSPSEWMENIYWIILEGLNNSLKHSQASRVHISIVDDVYQFTVEIKDNGIGFTPSAVGGGGFGMRSMQERAEMLGGVISVESAIGQGTRVKCVLEIPK